MQKPKGIIGGAMVEQPASYSATTGQVDNKSTVAGQMDSILGSDSPYVNRAQTISKQQSNNRGLMNSSMAAQAGTAAAIDAAMPIAQQDAQTNMEQSLQNQQAQNQAAQFNADTLSRTNMFNSDVINAYQMKDLDQQHDMGKLTQQQGHEKLVSEMETTQKSWDVYARAYAEINKSDLEPAAKKKMIDDLGSSLEQQMSLYRFFSTQNSPTTSGTINVTGANPVA